MLRVTLFGKFNVRHETQDITPALGAKVQELLCYLLLYHTRLHTREALADALWPDAAPDRSQKYLRQTLWQLQTVLDREVEADHESIVSLEPGWIHLNPETNLWSDIQIFEQAFALVRSIPGHELTTQQAQAVGQAIELYQGDLLADWYSDWCVYERERLQLVYFTLLDKLMDYCLAQQRYEDGLAYGMSILRQEPTREPTHCRLMRLYYLSGNRPAALRQYERCRTVLAKEFQVEPARTTSELYEQIRADQLVEPPRLHPLSGSAKAKTLLPETLDSLQEILTTLAALQSAVQDQIDALSGQTNNVAELS
jgi:DNA-binding SARP family transcriptional activator